MGIGNIIVIGASAGGMEALKRLVQTLPSDLAAPIFIVWHMAPYVTGVLPQVLNNAGGIRAKNAEADELIEANTIYVAPPDHHLLVQPERIKVTKGPKENRFRPAVDPLFRSAAYAFGKRVTGVVLTGSLDDGTSGLWMIKHFGGRAVVQDPQDAEFPSMPISALRGADVDHKVPISEMGELLVRLTSEQDKTDEVVMERDELTEIEINVAKGSETRDKDIMKFGQLTPFTCPDCHGVLTELRDGGRPRFRCHTGHAFSPDTLLAQLTERIESSLYIAEREMQESVMLLNHFGRHLAEDNQIELSALYYKKAFEAEQRADRIRLAISDHEHLSADRLRAHTEDGYGK